MSGRSSAILGPYTTTSANGDVALDGNRWAPRSASSRLGVAKLDHIREQDAPVDRHDGFAAVYLAHRSAIYYYVRRMITNEADAEDLTLAAFEKALRAWERRPPEHEIRPWLFRIATNTCLDELRRRQRVQWQPWTAFISLFHPSQVAPDNPEESALRSERAALVRTALTKLPARDRAALVMRECHGLSVEEIGQALGISQGAAKVALFRARERLRAAYLQVAGGQDEDRSEGDKSRRHPSRTQAHRPEEEELSDSSENERTA